MMNLTWATLFLTTLQVLLRMAIVRLHTPAKATLVTTAMTALTT